MSEARNKRRMAKREQPKINKAAIKYDFEGCDICGNQPMGRVVYTIGRIGKRVVGVCDQHTRSLDVYLSMQFYMEGEENIRQREMAASVSTNGPIH